MYEVVSWRIQKHTWTLDTNSDRTAYPCVSVNVFDCYSLSNRRQTQSQLNRLFVGKLAVGTFKHTTIDLSHQLLHQLFRVLYLLMTRFVRGGVAIIHSIVQWNPMRYQVAACH